MGNGAKQTHSTAQTETLSKIDRQQDEVFNEQFEGCNYPQRKPQQAFFANKGAIRFQFVDHRHVLIAGGNSTTLTLAGRPFQGVYTGRYTSLRDRKVDGDRAMTDSVCFQFVFQTFSLR